MNLDEIFQLFGTQVSRAEKGILAARNSGNGQLLCLNSRQMFKSLLMQGLMSWRGNSDPKVFLGQALDGLMSSVQLLTEISENRQPECELPLEKGGIVASLLGREFLSGFEGSTADPVRQLDNYISRALLSDNSSRPQISVNDSVLTQKAGALAARTYAVYADILQGRGGADRVAEADDLFVKRSKDIFYCGGDQAEGGGKDNLIVVDYRLAAILRKIGYKGDSIHQWRW